MNYNQQRQQLKNEALNQIIKLYDQGSPKPFEYQPWAGTISEQRDEEVEMIIARLDRQLKALKKNQATSPTTKPNTTDGCTERKTLQ